MNETYVTIRGRLTADPQPRTTRAGAPMTTFRLATSPRRPVPGQPGQWADGEASFYDVLTFRSLAGNVAASLRKGHPVVLHGRQRITSWQREDGSTGWNVEVEADTVGHDLFFGSAAFSRVSLAREGQPAYVVDGEQPAEPSFGFGAAPDPEGGAAREEPAA